VVVSGARGAWRPRSRPHASPVPPVRPVCVFVRVRVWL
jgi:hypothetical protein